MKQEQEQLNLLATFHLILGILTCIGTVFPLVYVGLGIAGFYGFLDEKGSPMPHAVGWMFIAIGLFGFLIWLAEGIIMLIAAKKLRNRESRNFCIIAAGIECIMTPLGTILGVFTIVILMKESVAQLFASQTLPENPYQQGQPGTELLL